MDMNKLLAAAAVAVLFAGTNLAIAQSGGSGSPTGSSGAGGAGAPGAGSGGAASQRGSSGPSPAGGSAAQGKDDAGTPGAGVKPKGQRTGQSGTQPGERSGSSDTQKGEHAGSSETQESEATSSSDTKKGERAGSSSKDSAQAPDRDKSSGGSANVTAEQRTRIKQSIVKQGNAPKVDVDFEVSVGTAVPRSVKLVTVPSAVIEIHPAWRGYEYFMTEDDEIVIVDPKTMRIVAVIDD